MRVLPTGLMFVSLLASTYAQDSAKGPSNEKAQKTYQHALDYLHQRRAELALDEFKKADKQDDGHCVACQKQMIKYGVQFGDWKGAELAGEELIAEASSDTEKALAHYQLARVLFQEATQKHKDELFSRAHDEIGKAVTAYASFPEAYFLDGKILANLNQDDAAKANFEKFTKMLTGDSPDRQRAFRYIARPELARARMAPPFVVTTLDGQNLSLDDLEGKVVLLDFWATWCPPCREAVPHLRNVAKKFQGEPLVVLSVSLDGDEAKWKEFSAKNEMTWPQYRDGGFWRLDGEALRSHGDPPHVHDRCRWRVAGRTHRGCSHRGQTQKADRARAGIAYAAGDDEVGR